MLEKTICKKELTLVSLWIRSNANGLERLNIMRNFLDTENTIIYNIKNIDTNTALWKIKTDFASNMFDDANRQD